MPRNLSVLAGLALAAVLGALTASCGSGKAREPGQPPDGVDGGSLPADAGDPSDAGHRDSGADAAGGDPDAGLADGGRPDQTAIAAAIAALPPGSWYEIPGTHLRDVAYDGWPSLPGLGFQYIIDSWSGGAFDPKRSRLIVWGGGHQGYGGNEVYAFDFAQFAWMRLSDPSPESVDARWAAATAFSPGDRIAGAVAAPTTLWNDSTSTSFDVYEVTSAGGVSGTVEPDWASCSGAGETCADGALVWTNRGANGFAASPESMYVPTDGQPLARHTYNFLQVVPSLDALCAFGSVGSFGDGQSGSTAIDCFGFASGRWMAPGSRAPSPIPGWKATAVEAREGFERVWALGADSNRELWEYDPAQDVWSQRSGDSGGAWNYYRIAATDPVRRRLVAVGSGTYWVFDLDPASRDVATGHAPRVAEASSGAQSLVESGYPTLDYDSRAGRLVGWMGGRHVYVLDLDRHAWSVSPGAAESPAPTEPAPNGTYGRWRYVPSLNVFAVVNAVDQNVWVYRYGP